MNLLQQFFDQLDVRLDACRKVEERLGKEVAHHFNVLKYLDTREIGLSHIIGDLLDPKGCHGQGSFFLKILMEELRMDQDKLDLDLAVATVELEYSIEDNRRIDVYIRIMGNSGRYCLAIENKPYACDQSNQVRDYLQHLENNFSDRFWLIYLSPNGEPPSEYSLPRAELNDSRWKDRLMIMAYTACSDRPIGEDEFEDYRTPFSFIDWVAICHEKCRVDKLRWFLRDIESYCKKEIGDHPMPNDCENETVVKFLIEDADRLEIARQVSDSWPKVYSQVCTDFLTHLCTRIEGEMNETELLIEPVRANIQVVGISLSRQGWNDPGCRYPGQSIHLAFISSKYPYFSIYLPGWHPANDEKNENEKIRFELEHQLNKSQSPHDNYPWWKWAMENYDDWNCLVAELHRELQSQGGRITEYFVDEFVGIARKAVPTIDELNS